MGQHRNRIDAFQCMIYDLDQFERAEVRISASNLHAGWGFLDLDQLQPGCKWLTLWHQLKPCKSRRSNPMRLTQFTDYSLRVLIYLGLQGDERVTIREISQAYGISRNHLMKVVSNLTRFGYVAARRGPGGGLSLARPASKINLADVIHDMEEDLNLVECFCPDGQCVITPVCQLRKVLQEALQAWMKVLQNQTLQDLLQPTPALKVMLGIRHKAT